MEIIRVLGLSEEDVQQLKQSGTLLRHVKDTLTNGEAEQLSPDASALIEAIQAIAASCIKASSNVKSEE